MRGSKWSKWDLHVHSPESVLNNCFEGNSPEEKWRNYLAKLKSLTGFTAIAITDYCSIDGYRRVVADGGLDNVGILLPNVELRMLPVTGVPTAINIHFVFNPDIVDELDDLFFSKLEFQYSNETYTCQRDSLVGLGRAYTHDGNMDKLAAYREGVNQFKVSLDGLRKILGRSEKLKNNSIAVVSNSSGDGASGLQHSSLLATREEIYRFCSAIFSGNPSDREYFLGKGTDTEEDVKRKCGKLMPCIHGSDAHCLTEIGHPCARRGEQSHNCETDPGDCDLRFCWIKAEASFEGLRQILFEPDNRIWVGADPPPYPVHHLEQVRLSFPDNTTIESEPFCFSGKHGFEFSPYFNCIIGGRGTGKSTLLNLIAEKLNPDSTDFPPLREIGLPDDKGISDYVSIDSGEEKFVEFIGQNEIQNLASDSKRLTEMMLKRLLKLDPDGKLKAALADLERNLKGCGDQVELVMRCEKLQRERSSMVKEKQAYEKVRDSIESEDYRSLSKKETRLVEDTTTLDTSREKFVLLLDELRKLRRGKELLVLEEKSLNTPLYGYERAYRELVASIEAAIKVAEKTDFRETDKLMKELDGDLVTLKAKMKQFLTERGIKDENLTDISTANDSIARLNSGILAKDKELRHTQEMLKLFDGSLLVSSKENYLSELSTQIEAISGRFELDDSEVRPIALEMDFDKERAKEHLLSEFRHVFGLESEREDYLANHLFETEPDELSARGDLLKSIARGNATLNKTQQLLSRIFKQAWAFEVYRLLALKDYSDFSNFGVIRVIYDEKQLDHCSFGQRCTAAIIILLSTGNHPIIIDEPEAHLDSALIANCLVKIVKKAKRTRQIIFATHNANFVVNGDAELIYSLEMQNRKTVSLQLTIEDLSSRPKLLSLEGGRDAFRLRGEKYGDGAVT